MMVNILLTGATINLFHPSPFFGVYMDADKQRLDFEPGLVETIALCQSPFVPRITISTRPATMAAPQRWYLLRRLNRALSEAVHQIQDEISHDVKLGKLVSR
ncbi:MAG: hypothetical protein ABIU05_01465 [Nitrospirales bacterium]